MKLNAFTKAMPNAWLPKIILRVMKLTTLLLIITLVQVSAKGFSQKINLNEKNAPLEKVLHAIEQQSGYVFFYDSKDVKQVVSIHLVDATIEDALSACFKDVPLTYKVADKTVFLQQKEPTILDKIKAVLTPSIGIRGRVYDEKGAPMPGVTVKAKDESHSTITDKDGYFFLDGINGKAVLVISSVGYLTKEINADDPLVLDIRMVVSNSKLDEVQVIAYGETSQRLNTGDVTTVSAKDIGQQPVTNPLLALEGRVPGLFIAQDNGIPGGGVTVAIRGQNSIQSGNDPLYVIDGVPYASQLLPTQIGGILGTSSNTPQIGFTNIAGNGNPLSFINPADIESISVLKDAGATAIYGSRGANGVILITTKKGKAGQTKVDVNVQSGYGQVTRRASLLNTQQYLEMRNEALKNDGLTASLDNGDYDLLQWDTKSNTDWQKVLLGNTAHYTDAQGSISGGNELTQFLIGGGYNNQTTVFPGDFADRKASMHFNINNTSPNKKFNITLTGSYSNDDNRLPQTDLAYAAYTLPPDAPALRNPDGSINWAPSSTGTSTLFSNPLAADLQTFQNKTNNLIANSVLSYRILPGLNIRSSFGYTNMQTEQQNLTPLSSQAPENRLYNTNNAILATNNINSWIIEPQISYKKEIGKGRLEVLLGSTFEQNDSKEIAIQSSGYANEANLGDISYASNITSSNYIESVYKYNALFGRLNYNWDDEYLVDLTGRRDGSSRFGANHQFHDFGAGGIGWIFTKEAALTKALPFLSYGKLRASYGTTGNDQIGDYQYLSLYNTVYAAVPYQGAIGLNPANLANPNLEWELTKKFEVALELGFFHDRILLTGSYSSNRSSNELLGYNLPSVTGFSSIQTNFPATVGNTSWEFSLNTNNVKGNDFNWTSNFNLTVPRNKLIAFPNLAASTYANTLVIGQPLNIQKVFHYTGVDPATGEYSFASATDKYNPDYNSDRNTVINTTPKFYGGFQNTISYKSFRLDFLFQFVKQTGKSSLYLLGIPGNSGNQFSSVLTRWQKPGDVTNIQRYSSVYYNVGTPFYDMYSSDAAYTDASYIRLKNLAFSWQVKNDWVKAMHIQSLRLFIQGQDLLTITHYKGLDPEAPGSTSLPPIRVLTAGINIGL
jgi:TonB-dependent starch-binding outer membrane protein SusC